MRLPHLLRALALAGALATGGAPGRGAAAPAPDRVRLQLKWFHQFQFAGYYAAQARGFYRDERLDVEIVEGSPLRAPDQEVLQGRAAFGILEGADLLHLRLGGGPVVAVAVVFQHSPAVVVSRRQDGLLRPRDLAGRTIMTTGDQPEAAVRAMLRRDGVALDGPDPRWSVRSVPHTWDPADLANGKVDALSAYLTNEPEALRRLGVEPSLLRPLEYGIDFYGDTLFTSEAFLDANREVVERFVRASMKGWDWAMAHPAEAADLVLALDSARSPKPPREKLLAEAAAMRDLVLPDLVELGHMNHARWERMADELRQLGEVGDLSRLDGLEPSPGPGRLVLAVAGAAAGVLLLAAVAFLWAWQLRRRVRERTADLRREVRLREAQSRELEESLRTNRALLSGIPDLIFVNRRDGTFVDYHARRLADLAIPPEAFLGKKVSDLFPPDLAARSMALYERALAGDEVQQIEYPLDAGGVRRHFELRVARQGPDTVLSIVRDVTEAHQARERLALLGAAIEQAAEDVLITDAAGVIRYVNPSFERTTGWAAAEVAGRTPAFLKSGLHDEAFYRELWGALAAGRPWQGRFTNRTKDGRLVLQDATIVAIRGADGAVSGYVSTRADVTRRVEMESRLAHSQRMEAIGTLAGGIAHDFNNILAAIMGNAELALDCATGGPALEELRSILDASQRAADLVRQILAFSRQTVEEAHPVPVATLVAEALKFLRSTLPSSVLVVPRLASPGLVLADPGELQRVLLNLCTNAAHAMRDGGGRLEVQLEDTTLGDQAAASRLGLEPGRYLRLTVADTGCGMTAEVKARIFEPFFTTRRQGEGTGLGLSIVHGVVKRLGGAIHVESAPGMGTTFDVYLPALPAGAGVSAATTRPSVPGAGRILVIDDEPMLVQVLERSLARLGYGVRAFTSPLEALDVLEADPGGWDAVVTDLAMAQLPGEEVVRRVLAVRPDLPVFLCTGNRRDLTDEAARALGVAEVLEKPVRASELSAALHRRVARPA